MFVPATNMYIPVYFSYVLIPVLASDRQILSDKRKEKERRQKGSKKIDSDVSTQFPIFV